MIVLGLLILIAAVVVGVAGVVANTGDAHRLSTDFTVFNQHFTGTEAQLFVAGVVVGAVGMFGLALLLGGAVATNRRHAAVRRELRASRREVGAVRRDVATAPTTPVAPATPVRAQREAAPSGSHRPWNRFLRKPADSAARSAQPQP